MCGASGGLDESPDDRAGTGHLARPDDYLMAFPFTAGRTIFQHDWTILQIA
jgi:hypothetical protein